MKLNLIEAADQFVVKKIFEPFTQWFQKLTGLNAFWWARLTLITLIIEGGVKRTVQGRSNLFVSISMIPFAILAFLFIFPNLYRDEKMSQEEGAVGLGNPIRSFVYPRILMIAIVITTHIPYKTIFDMFNI